MDKIKVLVVEDEIIIADNICDTLNNLGFEALEPAMTYTDAIALIEDQKPNIAVLDIQLGGKRTGIDLGKKINDDYDFPFIFLTSNADKATLNEAKKVKPSAYLIKPFSKEELYTTIEIVINNFLKKEEQISEKALFVKSKGSLVKISFDDILYLKSEHVYIEIVLKNKKKYLVRGNLYNFINKLNDKFIQVHRSYIVNINYIKEIDSKSLTINEENIPFSKKHKESIFNRLNLITPSK